MSKSINSDVLRAQWRTTMLTSTS